MIPTMLVAGFLAGLLPPKWALFNVVVLGLGWSILLLAVGTISTLSEATWAALLGLANAALGALVSLAIRLGMHRVSRSRTTDDR